MQRFTLGKGMSALALYEFSALTLQERADVLWQDGTYLLATDSEQGRSAFYAFADYWVEVVMESDPQRIVEVVPFRTGDRLIRLLNHININLP